MKKHEILIIISIFTLILALTLMLWANYRYNKAKEFLDEAGVKIEQLEVEAVSMKNTCARWNEQGYPDNL